jgi:two-component system cell cycle response regulator DivK
MNHYETVGSWTVLVVDDEPDSIEVVTDVLEFHGATVHSASDGQRAMELLRTVRPTFILTDLSMPIIDGWALLAGIRNSPELDGVPIIALTAHAMRGDADRALAAGFTAYLTKPLSPFSFIADILERLPALAEDGHAKL